MRKPRELVGRKSPHRPYKYWPLLLDQRLAMLWYSGKSIVTIAKILAAEGHTISRNAVAGKRRRLGLPPRGSPIGRRARRVAANQNQILEHVA